MGPVRQNAIQRTVRTAHLGVLMTVHNFSDNLLSNLQTTIIAQMLSIGGKDQEPVTDNFLATGPSLPVLYL